VQLLDFLKQLNYGYFGQLLASVIPAILCITVHESSHGIAAYALGDPTARNQGRISLNPLRHIDPFGLIMLALFHFGWAKPVSVDPRHFKNPKWGMAITALAGPVSNFLLAGSCYLLLQVVTAPVTNATRFIERGTMLPTLLSLTMQMSIGLGIFNLIPFPPLDGSKVLFAFLPDKYYFKLMHYERYGMIVLIVIMLAWRYLPGLLQL
jgi:Zn-dependent protease